MFLRLGIVNKVNSGGWMSLFLRIRSHLENVIRIWRTVLVVSIVFSFWFEMHIFFGIIVLPIFNQIIIFSILLKMHLAPTTRTGPWFAGSRTWTEVVKLNLRGVTVGCRWNHSGIILLKAWKIDGRQSFYSCREAASPKIAWDYALGDIVYYSRAILRQYLK